MGYRRASRECPLCGSEATLFWSENGIGKKKYFVYCMNERCGLGSSVTDTEEEALKSWNGQLAYAKLIKAENRTRH